MQVKLDEKAKTITIVANYDPKGVQQKPDKNGTERDGLIHCKAGGGWPVNAGVKNSIGNDVYIGLTVLSHPVKKSSGDKPMQA